MPTPQSSRMNLDKARGEGRLKFWRSNSESQRVKAEIVWLHQTQPQLSQRVIARMFRVSQPYVARLLKRVRLSGCDIERAIGSEAYRYFRQHLETQGREHFQAQGAPASLMGERKGNAPAWTAPEEIRCMPDTAPAFNAPRPPVAIAATKVEAPEVEYVEMGRSTSDEIIEMHGSRPSWAPGPPAPAYLPRVTLSIRDRVELLASGFVYDQCPRFGRR